MSQYIPLPELAAAIRRAPIEDAIQTFKAIATAVVHAYQLKKATGEEWTDSRNLKDLRAKISELQHGLEGELARHPIRGPHLLTPFQTKVTLELIYLNIDKIAGHPSSILFERADAPVTVAEQWLINCTMQPECDREGDLRHRWWTYFQEQPRYAPLEDEFERFESLVHRFEVEGTTTSCPGLVNMIRRLESVKCHRGTKEMYLLRCYLELGATAAHIWTHMWQNHGTQRGQPLPLDDYHVQRTIRGIQEFMTVVTYDWASEVPRPVRQELALHNFAGEFLFLLNHIFPNIIAPVGSTIREDMFGWEMHQYIVRCATSAEADPVGFIAFNLSRTNLSPAPRNGSRTFYEPNAPFLTFPDDSPQQDIELEAYGPLIDVDDVAEPGYPSKDDICTICQFDFDTAENQIGESSCSKLNCCEHMFHRDCLHDFLNGVHVDKVKCCNCRTVICNARPRRAKEA